MLLKYSQYQKRTRLATSGKAQKATGGSRLVAGKGGHRRLGKGAPAKRLARPHHPIGVKRTEVEPVVGGVDLCDNSNDSGLGLDHSVDYPRISPTFTEPEYWSGLEVESESKKRRLDIKLETDDANDNFSFPRLPPVPPLLCMGGVERRLAPAVVTPPSTGLSGGGKGKRGQVGAGGQSCATSRDGKVQLQILTQPETQHRARYQTEGSRGAVKDRTGNGFPVVKLCGYESCATLEVYIGTDQGRVAPHMFYQACRVSGKNSTPCVETKVDGTVLIRIEFDPSKDMVVTCDCVGILKERNVDVEHRFPEETCARSKKKSTRCRMVFRTTITRADGSRETLQVTSQPIVCTQPPGVPEICKKSLTSCPVTGGLELFILGKNFLKDTRVMFSEGEPGTDTYWESVVQPDKDFLQQSHLVCVVPPYRREDTGSSNVRLQVVSAGKRSEAHPFLYTTAIEALSQDPNSATRVIAQNLTGNGRFEEVTVDSGFPVVAPVVTLEKPQQFPQEAADHETQPVPPKSAEEGVWGEMMPPPTRSEPSMDTLRRFVSGTTPLPALSVDTYLSHLENKPKSPIQHTFIPKSSSPVETAYLAQPKVSPALSVDPFLPRPKTPPSLNVDSYLPQPKSPPLAVNFLPRSKTPPPMPADTFISQSKSPPPLTVDSYLSRPKTPPPIIVESYLPQPKTPPPIIVDSYLSRPKTPPPMIVESYLPQQKTPPPMSVDPFLSQTKTSPPLTVDSYLSPPKNPTPLAVETFLSQTKSDPPLVPVDYLELEKSKTDGFQLVFSGTGNGVFSTGVPEEAKRMEDAKVARPKEEGIPLPQELTQMSEHDLLSYINPSCFDQV